MNRSHVNLINCRSVPFVLFASEMAGVRGDEEVKGQVDGMQVHSLVGLLCVIMAEGLMLWTSPLMKLMR